MKMFAIANQALKNTFPQKGKGFAVAVLTKKGNILVDEHQKTSLNKVFAGGDIVLGAASVMN